MFYEAKITVHFPEIKMYRPGKKNKTKSAKYIESQKPVYHYVQATNKTAAERYLKEKLDKEFAENSQHFILDYVDAATLVDTVTPLFGKFHLTADTYCADFNFRELTVKETLEHFTMTEVCTELELRQILKSN